MGKSATYTTTMNSAQIAKLRLQVIVVLDRMKLPGEGTLRMLDCYPNKRDRAMAQHLARNWDVYTYAY